MRSTEPIEVPPYLCTMSAIVVLNRRKSRAGAPFLMRRVLHVLHVFHVLHQKPLDENTSNALDRCDRRLKLDDEARWPHAQGWLARKMQFWRLKTRLLDGKAA